MVRQCSKDTRQSVAKEKIVSHFSFLLRGWYHVLRDTSDSCAVWETKGGRRTENFLSRSGFSCDGVTRMLPALAAWTAGQENPGVFPIAAGEGVDLREIILRAVTAGTDPTHRDFWGWPSPSTLDQRQIEASNVALTLWLARDWFFDACDARTIQNVANWCAAGSEFLALYNNRAMFAALNHACCLVLSDHGMRGNFEDLAKLLRFSNQFLTSDGWMWDYDGGGMDYYNFWTNGSHHALILAIHGQHTPEEITPGIAAFEKRLTDLPQLIDRKGRNILFGRSLPYRWAIMSGAVAAQFYGSTALDPAVVRSLLEAQLDFWKAAGAMDENGVLRATLTTNGGPAVLSDYINCGHPYWCMQAFLCLGLSEDHPFWTAPTSDGPAPSGTIHRPEVGIILQSLDQHREVRLYHAADLDHPRNALYQKFVYSSAFPCNCLFDAGCTWDQTITLSDNQLTLRLDEANSAVPSSKELLGCEESRLQFRTEYRVGDELFAWVETTLTILSDGYETRHVVRYSQEETPVPWRGFEWVEGGFVLGSDIPDDFRDDVSENALCVRLESGSAQAESRGLAGWQSLNVVKTPLSPSGEVANLCHRYSIHANLFAPADPEVSVLQAFHSARDGAHSAKDRPAFGQD